MQKLADKEAKKREEEWKKRKPKRKLSFSEGMRKHDDLTNFLKNPLKDAKGPSIMKARTIMQMIKAGRFPTRELVMNIPY